MSGRRSSNKGARTECALIRQLLDHGLPAIVKADRQKPLVVLRISPATEIAKGTA